MSKAHNFVRTDAPPHFGEVGRYWVTIHCTKCGYVSFFGNERDLERKERELGIPKTCIEGDATSEVSA